MQTPRWQVLLAMNAAHCAVTVGAETKVHWSPMERNWIDGLRQEPGTISLL